MHKRTNQTRNRGAISSEEYQRAKTELYKRAQMDAYAKEVTLLKNVPNESSSATAKMPSKSSPINNRSSYLDKQNENENYECW